MSKIDQLKEQLREAKSQSRVNGQHRVLYQGQRDELRKKLKAIKTWFEIYRGTKNMITDYWWEFEQILEDQSSEGSPQ